MELLLLAFQKNETSRIYTHLIMPCQRQHTQFHLYTLVVQLTEHTCTYYKGCFLNYFSNIKHFMLCSTKAKNIDIFSSLQSVNCPTTDRLAFLLDHSWTHFFNIHSRQLENFRDDIKTSKTRTQTKRR